MLNNYLCKNNDSMAKTTNPFIVTGKIEPEYFCDRVTESARLVKSVTNGNNMVIISPRRMGKTGLIQFCYDKPEIADEYYTFFIDILHTSSLSAGTCNIRNPSAPQPQDGQPVHSDHQVHQRQIRLRPYHGYADIQCGVGRYRPP